MYRLACVLWLLSLCAIANSSTASGAEPFRHDLWNEVTQQFVVPERGFVRYRDLKQNPEKLNQYVKLIGQYSPDNAPAMFSTQQDRLAYWINAYNALIVYRVVQSYPIKSIKDLGGVFSSVFNKTQLVGGKELSYNDIEHGILRKRFEEPRIHFVLNCASFSCAPLPDHAVTADNLEAALQTAAVNFLNNPKNVSIDPGSGVVRLSKYFDWYKDDFVNWVKKHKGTANAGVLDFVKLYLKPEKAQMLEQRRDWKIEFLDYDWSLNDAARLQGAAPATHSDGRESAWLGPRW